MHFHLRMFLSAAATRPSAASEPASTSPEHALADARPITISRAPSQHLARRDARR
jgi:hypothetical protein